MERNPDFINEENISQRPAIEVLKSLGYTYLSPNEADNQRGNQYQVILKEILKNRLKKINFYEYKGQSYKFSVKNINQAIRDIDEPLTDGLTKTNEKIFDYYMLGRSYEEQLPDNTKKSYDLKYIDWDDFDNNVFHVTEEFAVERPNGSKTIPDIVLFVNGIPFAVIECKKASISVTEGISQMIRNQGKDYIPQLFKFVQIVLSTNKNESKYATCETPSKFWSVWKEEYTEWMDEQIEKHVKNRLPTSQDKTIISLFSKGRLLDLTKSFTLFDNNIKKIARYQQFFAIKEIQKRVKTFNDKAVRNGGVIWHTQGSGKSLTMVMLAKILMTDKDINEAKVVIVTDRVNLDKQIKNTFVHTKLSPVRATSGSHLGEILSQNKANIVTTLIHKFNAVLNSGIQITDKNVFVMVDESHRTNYSDLHNKMKDVFVNACYLGFTGTPLLKKDKNTLSKFGGLIHKYTIEDGVADQAIVPLLYEGKMAEQNVNKVAIDNKLDIICRNLTDALKQEVMNKWSRFERIASSIQRIELIAFDINEHFRTNYKGTPYKAMLACNKKVDAIRYYEAFEEFGDLKTAVVISSPDQREGHDEVNKASQDIEVPFWEKMMKLYGSEDNYEESIKDEFVNGDELDILIVVDKLLTGFDAPCATVLYIDKPLKEHNLLQAIARVNRLYEGKDYGYIVDYRGLLVDLDKAMNIYGAGLDQFDLEDIKGAVHDVKEIINKLKSSHSQLLDIFKTLENKNDPEEYEVILGNDEIRQDFYDALSEFGKYLGIAIESEEIYRSIDRNQLEAYKRDLKFFQELRRNVKLRYSEGIDHKEYSAKMQKLLDNYISAEEIIHITNPVDILDEEGFSKELDRLGSDRAKADAIRTRLSKTISTKWYEDPAYYKKFSIRIQEALDKYKEHRISEADYVRRMNEIFRDYKTGNTGEGYPGNIRRNEHAKAFYGVIKEIVSETLDIEGMEEQLGELSLRIKSIIEEHTKVDWHENMEVHKSIEQDIDDLLFDFKEEEGIELTIEQIDKIIESVKTVALRRF